VHYGANTAAVEDVSLRIMRGERVALVGESGSGKTTLGLAIAGFLTQPGVSVSAKTLEFEGQAIPTGSTSRLPTRVPAIAMVFQDAMTSLDPVWTIGSQLRAVIRANEKVSRKETEDRARHWLERVGLPDTKRILKNRSYELSGGMRQRIMIALALCGQPKLLIADEPTSALDASLSRKTMDLLLQLTQDFDTSLLIVSHDIRLCQEYSDTTMVMYRGHLVEAGPSATLDSNAQHPYTIGLLSCIPTLDRAFDDELPTLETVVATGPQVVRIGGR
jgi:ABC-type dipeptide/oligopeptide/nickel transport system ATPase component